MPRPERRKSVCLAIEKLADRSGGAERILIELANALARRGHPVQIVTYERRGKRPFYPLGLGVALFNLRRPDNRRSLPRRLLDRLRDLAHGLRLYAPPFDRLLWASQHGGYSRALERHLALHAPDVAIAFLPPAISALGMARTEGVRRISSIHNVPAADLADPERWDPNPLDRRRRMAALAASDAVTVLLPEFRDWFAPEIAAKVALAPNPVKPVSKRRRAAAARRKVVMSVGRLAAVKRHDLLIDAWARIAGDRPDWRVEIYGVGPDAAALTARIHAAGLEGSVTLMGHHSDITDRYLTASILAHPARHEGWGLAVSEALAAGTPAIGFADCPGVNRLIEDGRTGVLVQPGADRVAALAAALARLIDNPQERQAMGAAGPAAMARYAPDRITDIWERIIDPQYGDDDAMAAATPQ